MGLASSVALPRAVSGSSRSDVLSSTSCVGKIWPVAVAVEAMPVITENKACKHYA